MKDKIWELPNDEPFVIKKNDIPTVYCIEDLVDTFNKDNNEAQIIMDTDENGDVNIEKAEFYFASGEKWNFADESDDEE